MFPVFVNFTPRAIVCAQCSRSKSTNLYAGLGKYIACCHCIILWEYGLHLVLVVTFVIIAPVIEKLVLNVTFSLLSCNRPCFLIFRLHLWCLSIGYFGLSCKYNGNSSCLTSHLFHKALQGIQGTQRSTPR